MFILLLHQPVDHQHGERSAGQAEQRCLLPHLYLLLCGGRRHAARPRNAQRPRERLRRQRREQLGGVRQALDPRGQVAGEVEPLGEPARIVLQSVLSANQPTVEQRGDPRAAAALRAPLVGEYHTNHGLEAALGHRTRRSGLRMAVSMDHVVEGPDDTVIVISHTPIDPALVPRLEALCAEVLGEHQLTVESCDNREKEVRDLLQTQIDAEDRRLARLAEKIIKAMSAFKQEFRPDDSAEVRVGSAEDDENVEAMEGDDVLQEQITVNRV